MERFVLVKGWRDSGKVEAAYGPYTKEHAEWLAAEFADGSTYAWSVVQLKDNSDGRGYNAWGE